MDRRTLLKSFGALAAAPLLRGCASAGARPISETIDTVVVLMMENRSFDHYYGALSLVEARPGLDGLTASMSNPKESGELVAPMPADASCIADPGHAWNPSHTQFNGGANDGFVKEYEGREGPENAHRVMGFLDRAALPASYGLADQFTICNRWFSSLMAGTWPNRFYLMSGQSKGVRTNDESATYDMPTVYDVLNQVGRSWGIYYGNVSFSTLFTRNYPREQFYEIDRFFDDAAAGVLPNLTIVEPVYGLNDDHPPLHPLAGQIFIAQIYDALAASPQWGRVLFIVVYDEHGGFFDHVPPPKAPDARAADGFDQLGFRVPAVIAGPYVKRRFVSDEIFEHTSMLATVHSLFGSNALTMRDAAANDLTSVLDLARIEAKTPAPGEPIGPIEADESVIRGPGCTRELGFLRGTPPAPTGQPELERWLDSFPEKHWSDRRARSHEIYESLLERAKKRGVFRPRSR